LASTEKESTIKQAIDAYFDGQNATLLLLFHSIKEQIITEFNNYQTSLINKIVRSLNKKGFVTSQEYPELLNQENWKTIKTCRDNLKVWLIYDRGKSIAYVWDQNKLSEIEARKKAELQLLLI